MTSCLRFCILICGFFFVFPYHKALLTDAAPLPFVNDLSHDTIVCPYRAFEHHIYILFILSSYVSLNSLVAEAGVQSTVTYVHRKGMQSC